MKVKVLKFTKNHGYRWFSWKKANFTENVTAVKSWIKLVSTFNILLISDTYIHSVFGDCFQSYSSFDLLSHNLLRTTDSTADTDQNGIPTLRKNCKRCTITSSWFARWLQQQYRHFFFHTLITDNRSKFLSFLCRVNSIKALNKT